MTISQILGSIKFARMHQKNIVTLFFHKFCAIYIHQFLYKFIIFPFENPMYEIMNSLSVYLSIYTSFLTKKKKAKKKSAKYFIQRYCKQIGEYLQIQTSFFLTVKTGTNYLLLLNVDISLELFS